MVPMGRTFLAHAAPNRNRGKENDHILDEILAFGRRHERYLQKTDIREQDKRQQGPWQANRHEEERHPDERSIDETQPDGDFPPSEQRYHHVGFAPVDGMRQQDVVVFWPNGLRSPNQINKPPSEMRCKKCPYR